MDVVGYARPHPPTNHARYHPSLHATCLGVTEREDGTMPCNKNHGTTRTLACGFQQFGLPYGLKMHTIFRAGAVGVRIRRSTHSSLSPTVMKKTPFLSYILAALLACSGIPHAAASTASNVHLTDDAPSWDVKANNWYYTYTDENNGVKYACYDLFVDAKDGSIVNGGWSSNIYIHSGASLTADYLLQWTDNSEGSELWRILYLSLIHI